MPLFSPITFALPKVPKRQVMHSLDNYDKDEILALKKTEDNFINVIHPQDTRSRDSNLVRKMWVKFLHNEWYIKSIKPSFFYYKICSPEFQTIGFLGGVCTSDIQSNTITKHEKTYPSRVDHMTEYIKTVQIQAEPVMMIHETPVPQEIKSSEIEKNKCFSDFEFEGIRHQLWHLTFRQSKVLENWAKKQSHFHLADGHHRIQCMVNLSQEIQKPLFPLSYLVHQSQIKLHSFVWYSNAIFSEDTFLKLEQIFIKQGGLALTEVKVSTNQYPLVIQIRHLWFGFTKEAIKSENIPDFITHYLLSSFSELQSELNYKPNKSNSCTKMSSKNQLAFYMKPFSKSYLFNFAKKQKVLPAKSTFILPKLLSGMVVSPFIDI